MLAGFWIIVFWGAGNSGFNAYAANGCGGGQSCGVIDVNVKSCTPTTEGCDITARFISTGCDTITQDECSGFAETKTCRSVAGDYFCDTPSKKINCCTSGGGGGGGGGCQAGQEYVCNDVCKRESGCNDSDSGGGCGTANDGEPKVWCRECNCVGCAKTAPGGLTATSLSETIAQFNWTPGTDSGNQKFYLDTDQNKVALNCADACLINKNLTVTGFPPAARNTYTTDAILNPDTTYYYRIVNTGGEGCSPSADSSFLHWSTEPPAAAEAWWQVNGGNIHADSGAVVSDIPATATEPYLITQSGVDDTGLLSFSGSVSLGEGTINENGEDWQAETVYQGTQTGFDYFQRILSDDPAGIAEWTDGNLPAADGVYLAADSVITEGTWNVGSGEKIVLLVDGEVTIGSDINVDSGGFLAIIASGSISAADSVTNIEGVFIADGNFSSGGGDQQLTGEGIFTGWSGVTLGRVLADNSLIPAEKFIYRPDLQLNAYRYLFWLNIAWREVAP